MKKGSAYPHTSLCIVVNKTKLKRLADVIDCVIQQNITELEDCQCLTLISSCGTNVGSIGIWSWRTRDKVYGFLRADVLFHSNNRPIEIITLPNCNSYDNLMHRLLSGISIKLSSGKALIAYHSCKDVYYGLLCTDKDIDANGKIQRETLPLFEISSKNFIRLDGKIFYSNLSLGDPKYNVDVNSVGLLPATKPASTQTSAEENQLNQLKDEIEKLSKRRVELEQEIEQLQRNRDELVAQQTVPTVESVVDDDYVYEFEDALGMTDKDTPEQLAVIEKFALYMRAAFDNKTPLLLAGPKGREIADAFSTALTGKTAAVFDCAAVKSLDDLKVIEVVDDPIVAIINPLAPNFIAYIPEIVGIKNKFIVALHPFAEDLKLEPRGLYNYFLPVFTELIIDSVASIRKTVKTLKSNVDGSTELFAEFPFEYVNGRGEKFLKGFKGDGAALDKMRAFMGGDDE